MSKNVLKVLKNTTDKISCKICSNKVPGIPSRSDLAARLSGIKQNNHT
jgi:hypothetical protein